jgi:hypothetical protein
MSPSEKGRFCDRCQKNVIDFVLMSDRELVAQLRGKAGVCGRIGLAQVNRGISVQEPKSRVWSLTAFGVLALITGDAVYAQHTTPKTEMVAEPNKTPDATLPAVDSVITGIVTDAYGPLPGVNVIVKRTGETTQTDFNGNFTIHASKGDTVDFMFVGMTPKTCKINLTDKAIKLVMTPSEVMMGEIIVVRKRSQFGRISVWIGNLFRSKSNKKPVRFEPQ